MIKLYSIALYITSKLLNLCVKLRLWKLAKILLDFRKKYIAVKLKQMINNKILK